jgi:hemolysin activation/secretion protein
VYLVWAKVCGLSRSTRGAAKRLLLTSILLTTSGSVTAQTAAQVLPPTREQITRPVQPTTGPRGRRLEVEGGIERAPCALDAAEYQNIRLTLRAADFEGLRGLTPADLSPAYAQYVGHEQPISIVCEIRDHAATILRNAGYVAAVQVPEQKIENGVVHFRVLMAHLAEVRVRGDATGAEKAIAAYLNQLTKQPIFNRFEAERYLLLASDLPGYTARLTLRPAGTAPGEVIGDVTVQRTPAYVDVNVQNLGSQEVGPWGGVVRAQFYGLTGLGDRTTLAAYTTADFHEQQTLQIAHDFRVGPEGLSIASAFTYSWERPDVPDAHILAKTLLTNFEVAYPFIRRQSQTLRGSIGFDYVNQHVDLDEIALSKDRLRVGYVRLGFDAVSMDFNDPGFTLAQPRWHFAELIELRKGFHILGASVSCGSLTSNCDVPPSRPEGQSNAVVLRSTTSGEFRPLPKLSFALAVLAQYSSKPLLSFEQFSAGNYTVGRGYDPGALIGDKGVGTQAEIRYGSRVPEAANRPAIEGFAFWDHANVGLNGRLNDFVGSRHLNSAGGGARINFERFALDAALAVPLTRIQIGADQRRPSVRFLVSLTSRLWPWSYQ